MNRKEMDGESPRPNRKRPLFEENFGDDETSRPPKQKKVRFPKGKKVKPGDEGVGLVHAEDGLIDLANPRLAAKERAKHRNQITAELFNEELNDMSAAEVTYDDIDNFVDDGIQIEPFNLDKEREEGYFDAEGNFVEYVNDNEIKDPWLDSIESDQQYARKSFKGANVEDDDNNNAHGLSSTDIGIIKRRIANLLEQGETVLQALRRLKGGSNKKDKMSAETQVLFDKLTEDANKLLEQGDYNVYHEKQEAFKREAEGYERLALARAKDILTSAHQVASGNDIFADSLGHEAASSELFNPNSRTSEPHVVKAAMSSDGPDVYDMFADDDDNATAKAESVNGVRQPSSDTAETRSMEDVYLYDDTSGYYYSSSSGYYYDPSTGLYCYGTSGQWYSFNPETGTYEEVNGSGSTVG